MSEKKVLTFSCLLFSPQLMKTLILKVPGGGPGVQHFLGVGGGGPIAYSYGNL